MTQEPQDLYQQAPPPPAPPPTSSLATTSLIAAILGWTIAPLLGTVTAIITGHMAKKEIKESNGRIDGDTLATIGLVMGYVQIIPVFFCICIIGVMFVMGISMPILDSIVNLF